MNETASNLLLICSPLPGSAAEVPTEIQVIPAGHHGTPKGDFLLDETAAQLVLAAHAARKSDKVVDYEHQTLSGKEAPAAGWIKKLVNRGAEGIWAVVEWTERAKGYIAAKEYRHVSPVFLKRLSDSRVVDLINVALTNQPNIDGMVPMVNSRFLTLQEKETSMKKLFALLGIAENSTEDQAVEAVNNLKSTGGQIVANKAVLVALGLKENASESEVTGTILAMKQTHEQHGTLAQKVEKLTKDLAARDASDLVAIAMKEGKITPAEEPWAHEYAMKDPEGFKTYVAKTPVKIQTSEVVAGQKPGAGGGLDASELSVCKQLGIDPEAWKKAYPATA